jgi:ribA/ribD-fused uncharacterized protein
MENGLIFNCTEQYFMYYKALTFSDGNDINNNIATKILLTSDPFEIKRLGREVNDYDDAVWGNIRYNVMLRGNLLKYSQNHDILIKLLSTGNKTLVEASPTDKIWGVGLAEKDPLILDSNNWQGQNLLGKCLMDVRTRLSI